MTGSTDVRATIPGTDTAMADSRLAAAVPRLGRALVKRCITDAQGRARAGLISPAEVIEVAVAALPAGVTGQRPVLNCTGVLLHTNLGRAPLSDAAVCALTDAAGTTDVELDLATGGRGRRGASAMAALAEAVPVADAVHVVNNGAAALALAATALATDREIVIARGEMVEIGDGFRIPELIGCTGARLREVGTTNRVHPDDYAAALGPDTGFVLKVHPSNFTVRGFCCSVEVADLAQLLAGTTVPLVVDIGSGLLHRHPRLPEEPDATSTLRAGAALVTASGDKLLGGPQAGLLLGAASVLETLRRHPLARALRVDKLTLAALEATLRGPRPPAPAALEAAGEDLAARAGAAAATLRAAGIDAVAVPSEATVGGGGAPGVILPSAAVSLPQGFAARLRGGEHPVLGRLSDGRCLLDLCAIAPGEDVTLIAAVRRARP